MFNENTNPNTTRSDIMNEFPLSGSSALMTPNTIKNIEQSILASLEATQNSSHSNIIASQATGSFVPPLPTTIITSNYSGGQFIKAEQYSSDSFDSDVEEKKPKKTIRKNTGRKGGRRAKNSHDNEEESRRLIRRERNKLAAARCRKRRVDHTNQLLEETLALEQTRSRLQSQIQQFQSQKEELEFILQGHNCQNKPKRPNSLPVNNVSNPAGIPITTPSNGLNLNFDDSIWQSTGLTPSTTPSLLVTPLITPGTARDILSGLGGKCVSL